MDLKAGDTIPETYKEWFRADIRHVEKWRKEEAKPSYEFRDGHQWSDEEEKQLEDRGQPPTVFNRVLTIIDAVAGQEISNRQEVRYIPRVAPDEDQGQDQHTTEIYTEAARYFRDQADADDNDSEAFRDTITGGMGWTETRLDYENNPDGELQVNRLNPFEMVWDNNATKKNLQDSRRFWHVKCLPIAEARAQVEGDVDDDDLDADWAANAVWDGDDPHISEKWDRTRRKVDGSEELTEAIIVHCQWQERETYYRVGGKDLTEDDYKTFRKDFAPTQLGIPANAPDEAVGARKQKRKVWYRAILGKKVLKVTPTACPKHSNFKCITGKRDQTKRMWFGLVRSMRDPQSWSNKFFSQILHILNSNAKGGILAERGTAFDNDNDAEESWARSDRITWMKQGALSGPNPKFSEKPQTQFPAGLQYLMEYANASTREAAGVSLELLGQKDTDQAGVLEYQRKQAGLQILAPLFDSLKLYRKDQGELILYYAQHDLSDGRLIRIVGEEQGKFLPLTKGEEIEYDIIVDDMPNSPNQKEMGWQIFTQILPYIKEQLSPETLLMFLEGSPLPTKNIEKMKRKVQEDAQAPMAQLQQRMAALEAQVVESKDMLQRAQAQQAEANAHKLMMESGDSPDPQAELALKQQESQGKLALKERETHATIALKREEMGANIQMKREEQAGEMQMRGAEMQFDHALRGQEAAQDAQIKERQADTGIAVQERTADAGIAIKAKQAKAAAKTKPAAR